MSSFRFQSSRSETEVMLIIAYVSMGKGSGKIEDGPMAEIQAFEDTQVWRDARELTRLLYHHAAESAFARDFRLRDQIRAAGVSIMSNIAEGYERDGRKELIHFLSVAKGSSGEVRSQLYVALDVGYVSEESHAELLALSLSISRQLSGWIKYLRLSKYPGRKYPDGEI